MTSPDFRYHVASLASVFLALGIGIAVGTLFVGTPFVERLEKRIQRQEKQMKELVVKARGQEGNEEALKMLLPRLVGGQLIGLEIVVVQLGDGQADGFVADNAIEAIQKAGGTARRLILPDSPWEKLDEWERGRQTRLLTQTLRGNMEASLRMTDELLNGDLPPSTVNRVVLAGGHEALRRPRDLVLAEALTDDGCTVVAVERMETDAGAVRIYKQARISFIDCIDRAVGQMALARALRGEKGWFGLKDGSEQVIPEIFGARPGTASPTPSPTSSPRP
jgi:hypothetical protein